MKHTFRHTIWAWVEAIISILFLGFMSASYFWVQDYVSAIILLLLAGGMTALRVPSLWRDYVEIDDTTISGRIGSLTFDLPYRDLLVASLFKNWKGRFRLLLVRREGRLRLPLNGFAAEDLWEILRLRVPPSALGEEGEES